MENILGKPLFRFPSSIQDTESKSTAKVSATQFCTVLFSIWYDVLSQQCMQQGDVALTQPNFGGTVAIFSVDRL